MSKITEKEIEEILLDILNWTDSTNGSFESLEEIRFNIQHIVEDALRKLNRKE